MADFWSQLDEKELIHHAQQGQADAFGELYTRYVNVVFRYVFSRVGNRQEAEDLTEEVFFKVWQTLAHYRDRGVPFVAFVLRVARNLVIDYHRHASQRVEHRPLDEHEWSLKQPNVEISFADLDVLRTALKDMKEEYRQVLLLRFISGLTPAETAQVMQRSEVSTRVLQHRALRALRKKLEGKL